MSRVQSDAEKAVRAHATVHYSHWIGHNKFVIAVEVEDHRLLQAFHILHFKGATVDEAFEKAWVHILAGKMKR